VIVRGITLFPLATCGTKPDLKGRLKTDEDRPKMFRENLGRALLALSIAFALSAGCAVSNGPRSYLGSYEMPYTPPPVPLAPAMGKHVTIGVAQFHDERRWVDPSDANSEGIIEDELTPSGWLGYHLGMTYQGRDYFPVKDFIQLVLIDQLRSGGFDARAIDRVVSRDNVQEIEAAERQQGVEYVLAGDILAFQWEMVDGPAPRDFLDVPAALFGSRRILITLPVVLVRTTGGQRLIDRDFLTAVETSHFVSMGRPPANNQRLLQQFNNMVAQMVQEIATKTAPPEPAAKTTSR
jgi:hypothetical protein